MTKRTGSTQRANIKKFLEDGYSLTALEALSLFGAYRLAAHIEVLRNRDGMPIHTQMSTDVTGRTYARYSMPVQTKATTPGERIFNKLMAHAPKQKEIVYHAH